MNLSQNFPGSPKGAHYLATWGQKAQVKVRKLPITLNCHDNKSHVGIPCKHHMTTRTIRDTKTFQLERSAWLHGNNAQVQLTFPKCGHFDHQPLYIQWELRIEAA